MASVRVPATITAVQHYDDGSVRVALEILSGNPLLKGLTGDAIVEVDLFPGTPEEVTKAGLDL